MGGGGEEEEEEVEEVGTEDGLGLSESELEC